MPCIWGYRVLECDYATLAWAQLSLPLNVIQYIEDMQLRLTINSSLDKLDWFICVHMHK